MNIYSDEDLAMIIIKTAEALTVLASGLDKQNEAIKLMVLTLEIMNKKLNEFTEKNSNKDMLYL